MKYDRYTLTNCASTDRPGDKISAGPPWQDDCFEDTFLQQHWKIGMMYKNGYFTIEKYLGKGPKDLLPTAFYLTSNGKWNNPTIEILKRKNFCLQK